jgi:hypothetical protein
MADLQLTMKTAAETLQDAQQQADAIDTQNGTQENFLQSLVGSVRGKWSDAQTAKLPIEQIMLRSKRARECKYEPKKLAQIRDLMGAEYEPVYIPVTLFKCLAAQAWLKDYLSNAGTVPWDMEPTEIPELPDAVSAQIEQQVRSQLTSMLLDQVLQSGQPVAAASIHRKVEELAPLVRERVLKEMKRTAKEAAHRMKEKIQDQFEEGAWKEALEDCIYDIVTFPACILKGPSLRRDVRRGRQFDGTKWVNQIKDEVIPKWERRSPFNIYPSPSSTGINDGYLFDKISMTPKEISDLIGLPGFRDDALRSVLETYRQGGLKEWTNVESERAILENRETSIYITEKIDCLEYWGSEQGRRLTEWAGGEEQASQYFGETLDPDKEYDIACWLIDSHIIKAFLNPDPQGLKPFSKASFIEDPDSFWGSAVPEVVWSTQSMGNAIGRALEWNTAISSGPQIIANKDMFPGGVTPAIRPFGKWEVTGEQMRSGKPVEFFQPELISPELAKLLDWCLTLADKISGIPAYEHGENSGTPDTATAFSMLSTFAARGVKSVINNINRLIAGSVERQYYYNLDYENLDPDTIGDMRIVAKRADSLIAKEQQASRRNDFKASLDQIDNQILGKKGRAELLREQIKSLEMDVDKLMDDDDVQEWINGTEPIMPSMISGSSITIPGNNNPQLNQGAQAMGGKDYAAFAGAVA